MELSSLDTAALPLTPFETSTQPFRFGALVTQRDWGWVKSLLHCHLVEDTKGIVAVDATGNYAAVCVLDSWTGSAVCAHIAVLNPRVLKHGFLQKIADTVFVTSRRSVIIGMVPANNEKALRFDKHIGFVELFRIKDGYNLGIDYVILEMRRENCRWITGERYDG